MKLCDFLEKNDIAVGACAAAIGVTQSAVVKYKNGRVPRAEVMARIVRFTKGAVQPNDFYNLGRAAAVGRPP